jgi:hypothetical protein
MPAAEKRMKQSVLLDIEGENGDTGPVRTFALVLREQEYTRVRPGGGWRPTGGIETTVLRPGLTRAEVAGLIAEGATLLAITGEDS